MTDDVYTPEARLRDAIRSRVEADLLVCETEIHPGSLTREQRRAVMREAVLSWLQEDGYTIAKSINGTARRRK